MKKKRPASQCRRAASSSLGRERDMELHIEGRVVEEEFVTLHVRVASADAPALERTAYVVAAQQNGVDVPQGVAPREALEQAMSEPAATQAMLEVLKNFIAPFALSVENEHYAVVGPPVFNEGYNKNEAGDVLLQATWTRLPRRELSSYDPVEVTVPALRVTEGQIDARMDEVAESYTAIEKDKSRSVVEEGAIVQISMECLKDGERFPQLCFEKRPYRAGSGQMPEGFDEAIVGARVGQTVHVDFLLPAREDVDGTMCGHSVAADVKIEAIMREVSRVLTNEFVRTMIPNLDSLDDLRAQCEREIRERMQAEMRHYRNFLVADELAKRVEGVIPDSAYDAVVNQMTASLRDQARAQHCTLEELLKSQGSSEEQFRMTALMQARTQLRQAAALEAWARYRNLEVADRDIEDFFASFGADASRMREEMESGGYSYLIKEGALRLKASEDAAMCAIIREDASLEMPGEAMTARS